MSGCDGGENEGNRRDRLDKKEVTRAGEWEMALSTSKPTGDWFLQQWGEKASELQSKMNRLHSANLCRAECVGADRVDWSSA